MEFKKHACYNMWYIRFGDALHDKNGDDPDPTDLDHDIKRYNAPGRTGVYLCQEKRNE